MTCPEYFREGEENTVICIITRSARDDKCVDLHASPHLMFTSKSKDNNYPLCIYSKSSKCGVCEDINDKETKCIYKVFGNRTLEGGDLECKVCSLWDSNKHEMNQGICKNIKIGKDKINQSISMALHWLHEKCTALIENGGH